MQKHFEGSTKSEAREQAEAWWREQSGLTAILRVTRPMDGVEDPTTWKVVVHYQEDVAAPPPRRL
jgi:hypothetical protein